MINKHPKIFAFLFTLFLIIVFLITVYYDGCFFGMRGWGIRGRALVECTPPDWGSFGTFVLVQIEFLMLILFFITIGAVIVLPFWLLPKVLKCKKNKKR